ncbi:hypothetical protein FACS1894111_00280 [Clostridia bacterium]|nr:hypothetical protein FACS1894111_00280 [Clostridia bacterium]
MKVNNIDTTTINGAAAVTASAAPSNFSSYLKTSASLEQIFSEASKTYGVPLNLIKAVAKAESDFNPNATSKSGAQGIMQLMPATARSLGVTDSYDPYQNIMGGTKYLAEMLSRYDGDTTLACAAYNAGSNAVKKYGGVPPYKETQNYVVKVANYMNEGVSVPNASYAVTAASTAPQATAPSTPTISSAARAAMAKKAAATPIPTIEKDAYDTLVDKLFSYDDYLKFLDLYLKSQELEKNKAQKEQNNEDEKKLAYQDIKYSPTVLNLIKSSGSI